MDYRIFNVCTDVTACDCTWGCMDTIRESALKVDFGRKFTCCTRKSNLCQWCASLMLYQLSYIPIQFLKVYVSFFHVTLEDHVQDELIAQRQAAATFSMFLCSKMIFSLLGGRQAYLLNMCTLSLLVCH